MTVSVAPCATLQQSTLYLPTTVTQANSAFYPQHRSEFTTTRHFERQIQFFSGAEPLPIPMHTMIREIIPGRQQRIRRCPL